MTSSETELLLTGFEPFDRFDVNPSWESAQAAQERFGPTVAAGLLPVDYHAAREGLHALLLRHRPAACLCTGLTPSPEFRLERVARKPVQLALLTGEELLRGEWPWERAEAALMELGVSWRRSTDAGAYVCESTYWALLDFRQRHGYPIHAGFLHVPCVSKAYPLERTAACVEQIVGGFLARVSSSGSGSI